MIGVVFDIDELGSGLYGYAAYKVLFSALNTQELDGCALSDGDTRRTLSGLENHYCIALELDTDKIMLVSDALRNSGAQGLLPVSSRVLDDNTVSREPLVPAGYISLGELVDCRDWWILQAWSDSKVSLRKQV
jgi:hypothetical protein